MTETTTTAITTHAVVDHIESLLPTDDEQLTSAFARLRYDFSYIAPESTQKQWDTIFYFLTEEVVSREKTDDHDHWSQKIKRYWQLVVPRRRPTDIPTTSPKTTST